MPRLSASRSISSIPDGRAPWATKISRNFLPAKSASNTGRRPPITLHSRPLVAPSPRRRRSFFKTSLPLFSQLLGTPLQHGPEHRLDPPILTGEIKVADQRLKGGRPAVARDGGRPGRRRLGVASPPGDLQLVGL